MAEKQTCLDCGPGYFIGDDGCRHSGTMSKGDLVADLRDLNNTLDAQMNAIMEQAEEWNHENPFRMMTSRGSYPLVPLMAAQAQVLLALTMLEVK